MGDGLPPLGQLGWRGRFQPGSPEVQQLRGQLQREAGIKGLQIVSPAEEGFAAKAAALFHRDGFVMVSDALDNERLELLRRGCDHVIRKMLEQDPDRLGNRGSHRYSFGNSCAFFGCQKEFSVMIDPPVVLAVIEAIFGCRDFRSNGYGGDFVLPGCVEYQHLHRDVRDYLNDPSGRLTHLDMPCAQIGVNYPMIVVPGAKGAHTAFNGATRQIPGTQNLRQPIPPEEEEPRWMKLSTTAPAPAGCAMFRDLRCWHGGTPNLSNEVRAIPGAGFLAPWYNPPANKLPTSGPVLGNNDMLPPAVYQSLSEDGKRIAGHLRGLDLGDWKPDWDVAAGRGGGGEGNWRHQGLQVGKL